MIHFLKTSRTESHYPLLPQSVDNESELPPALLEEQVAGEVEKRGVCVGNRIEAFYA